MKHHSVLAAAPEGIASHLKENSFFPAPASGLPPRRRAAVLAVHGQAAQTAQSHAAGAAVPQEGFDDIFRVSRLIRALTIPSN